MRTDKKTPMQALEESDPDLLPFVLRNKNGIGWESYP